MKALTSPVLYHFPDAVRDDTEQLVTLEAGDPRVHGVTFIVGGKSITARPGNVTRSTVLRYFPTHSAFGLREAGIEINLADPLLAVLRGANFNSLRIITDAHDLPFSAVPHGALVQKCREQSRDIEGIQAIGEPYLANGGNGSRLEYQPQPTDKLIINAAVHYPPPIGEQHARWVEGDPDADRFADTHCNVSGLPHILLTRLLRMKFGRALGRKLTLVQQRVLPEEVNAKENEVAWHLVQTVLAAVSLLEYQLAGTISAVRASNKQLLEIVRFLDARGLMQVR